MENHVFGVGSKASLMLKDDAIWMMSKKVSSAEKFEKELTKTGVLSSEKSSITLDSISEVFINSASGATKLEYTNEKGKLKKESLEFDDKELANKFGTYIGQKLNLTKSETLENPTRPLLFNILYLVGTIGMTYFLASLEDTNTITDSTRRRGSGGRAILKMVVDTLGETGLYAAGTLISLYILYRMYQRYKSPAKEITYVK